MKATCVQTEALEKLKYDVWWYTLQIAGSNIVNPAKGNWQRNWARTHATPGGGGGLMTIGPGVEIPEVVWEDREPRIRLVVGGWYHVLPH